MIGLRGPGLTDADIRLFRDTRAGGLILYRRNFESPAQILDLLGRLESALGRRLLVATDHEGGRVIMLGRGTTIFPDNLAVGMAGAEAFAHRQGLIEGRELRRLGIDLNLGPCLDVLTDRYSPNIGIRSYGKDPAIVARYGGARIAGMMRAGLSACAKHFPGKGHSPLDAHLRLPTIDSTWDEMHARHLPPFFAAIERGVEALMTSHPRYPGLDPTAVPATFSRLIVHDYLRGEVGYRGVIVSDDLEMGAVSETCAIGEATVRAAGAGHDLLLVCHTEAAQRAAAAALVDAYRSGALAAARAGAGGRAHPAPARAPHRPRRGRSPRARDRRPRAGHGHRHAGGHRRVPGRARLPARAQRARGRRVSPLLGAGAADHHRGGAAATSAAGSRAPSAASASGPRSRWWASSRARPRSPRPERPRRAPTRRSSSSSTRISTRATARCSMSSRRGRVGWPSCSCAIPTTRPCWRARPWASPPTASGAASSRRARADRSRWTERG